MRRATSGKSSSTLHRCVAVLDELRDPHRTVGAKQLDEWHRAGEVTVVKQEHVGGDLGKNIGGTHRGECVGHGRIGSDRHEVRLISPPALLCP